MPHIFSKYLGPFKNTLNTSWITQNQEISYILFLFALYFHDYLVEEPMSKFYGVCHHVSRADKVTKFWMIKLCLEVTDIIHTNEHADFGLKWWKTIILNKSCYFSLRSPLNFNLNLVLDTFYVLPDYKKLWLPLS